MPLGWLKWAPQPRSSRPSGMGWICDQRPFSAVIETVSPVGCVPAPSKAGKAADQERLPSADRADCVREPGSQSGARSELEDLVWLHTVAIEEFGGSRGVRDKGTLESALGRPRASFGARTFTRLRSSAQQRWRRAWS